MVWDGTHLFECPTRIFYGFGGAANGLGERLASSAYRRAVLVSDPGRRAAGPSSASPSTSHGAGIERSLSTTDTEQNPTTTNLEEIAELYAARRCDGLVGLGGGSSMDAAKAAVGADRERRLDLGLPRQGSRAATADRRCVCLPTTCGTGAEVTFVVVITDPASTSRWSAPRATSPLESRSSIRSSCSRAPPHVIAATGADALAHAIESYLNVGSDPLLDSINIRAIRMIGANLRAAVYERRSRRGRPAVAREHA